MDVRIEEGKALSLVGIPVVGRREELSHRVPLAWLELVRKVEGIAERVEPGTYYGAFADDEAAQAGYYRYWVGVAVGGAAALPEGLARLDVPAQRYASVRCQGDADAIERAYLGLATWIEQKGLRQAPGGWSLERYDERRQAPTPPYERFDYDILRPLG